ncbi:MAG: nucleoside 2-deoxyribosyltransferase [Brevinematales bacterium]
MLFFPNSAVPPKILSILNYYHLQGKSIIICFPEQKEKMQSINISECPIPKSIKDILDEFPKNIGEMQYKILENLAVLSPGYGEDINKLELYDTFSKNKDEQFFFIKLLKNKGYVDTDIEPLMGGNYDYAMFQIGERGWLEIQEMMKGLNSKQVFVAMWFDPAMNPIYEAIERACRKPGIDFIPLKIDNKEHNNEISGEILYEINRSHFVIADVTHQRHGVYYEAGYAMGKNIPVIWCCKNEEKEIKEIHFDTRQYNHILWNDGKDLEEKLIQRIKGTILNK